MNLQWKLNHGRCLLTNLENWIRGEEPHGEESQFVKSILRRCLTTMPSDLKIRWGIYLVMWMVWGLSLARLAFEM
jgi:hypothetical protein